MSKLTYFVYGAKVVVTIKVMSSSALLALVSQLIDLYNPAYDVEALKKKESTNIRGCLTRSRPMEPTIRSTVLKIPQGARQDARP